MIKILLLLVLFPALSTIVSATRQLQEFDCGGLCTASQFCGVGGQCRSFSCANWYQYSPWNIPDRAEESDLVCEDYTTGEAESNWAVLYGCERLLPGSEIQENDKGEPGAYGFPFNRKCSVPVYDTGDGSTVFNCFDVKPGTDFEEFLLSHAAATWEKNPIRTVCDDTSRSGYYYNAYVAEPEERPVERPVDPTGVGKTDYFEDTFAYLTMHVEMSGATSTCFLVVTSFASAWAFIGQAIVF